MGPEKYPTVATVFEAAPIGVSFSKVYVVESVIVSPGTYDALSEDTVAVDVTATSPIYICVVDRVMA